VSIEVVHIAIISYGRSQHFTADSNSSSLADDALYGECLILTVFMYFEANSLNSLVLRFQIMSKTNFLIRLKKD
jgi:hypothetical protein